MDSTDDHGLLDPLLKLDDTAGQVTAGQVRVLCPASTMCLPKVRPAALLYLCLPSFSIVAPLMMACRTLDEADCWRS